MMTFYAAAGSYQIRSEDGKNMPYIMRLGKLQPVSIPEFSLWSMLLWDVLTYEELRKKFYDKMEETEIEPSSFDKSLEMLVKRKLIIKGVGYTGADALYNMLSDTYVIPLRGVQGMLLGLWSQPVLRKRSWMRNISGSARAMTRPLKNGQWIATIGDGSCVRFAAELSRMCRCPITVAREVQTGESVPIVHEMVVANPHSWLDIIRMMVYY